MITQSLESTNFQLDFSQENTYEQSLAMAQKAVGCDPIPVDIRILGPLVKFYMRKLGLPEENSDQFRMMKPEFQKRMQNYYYSSKNTAFLISSMGANRVLLSLKMAEKSLNLLLDEMQQLSIDILDDAATQTNN